MQQFGREVLTDPCGNISNVCALMRACSLSLSLISFTFNFFICQSPSPYFLISLKFVRGRNGCLIGHASQIPSLANEDDSQPRLCVLAQSRSY